MPRTAIDWRSASKENYKDFCKKNPSIVLSFDDWRRIVYDFNESFKTYLLETGFKGRLPGGFGEFSITKKRRKKIKIDPKTGREFINLPVDWQKTKEKGKIVYNFNYHTEGYFFGWQWFKATARLKYIQFWYFKPTRVTSRLLAHYIKADPKYQDLYQNWLN
jgi:nucleoid DNA-binding protein